QPFADRVRPGRQPFVRQGLPRREVGDQILAEQAAQRSGQLLGLPAGGCDGQDGTSRAPVGGERRDDELMGGGGAVEIQQRGTRLLHDAAQRRVGQQRGQ